MPVMVTGGIRRRPVVEQVLGTGVDMVGMATALAIDPFLPRDWRLGKDNAPELAPITWKNKPLAATAHMAAVKYQLARLSHRRRTVPAISPLWALIVSQIDAKRRSRRYRHWIDSRHAAA